MVTKVVVLEGCNEISAFRKEKINARFSNKQSKLANSKNLFVLEVTEQFTVTKKLNQILQVAKVFDGDLNSHQIMMGPRAGTISPWSSKATEILKNCNIENLVRVEQVQILNFESNQVDLAQVQNHIIDKMTDQLYVNLSELEQLFQHQEPKPIKSIGLTIQNLNELDQELGLALSGDEKQYLIEKYTALNQNPTDAELMMFAQANSEHCRHKIFNADWTIDGIKQNKSLFKMIRNTEAETPKPSISAYSDNSAVFQGGKVKRWTLEDKRYRLINDSTDILIKVETHNHPTAISPFPGAATGSGGEIRDEAATGQGARPKAGLTGFSVSHLQIPSFKQPWEKGLIGKPKRIASAFKIMQEAPIGSAAFNNEFGRPSICGYFRSFEINAENHWRGYHKPIMLAGGMGNVISDLALKNDTKENDQLVVLGGPAMLIGLGGGAASSVTSGSNENLDFASVQRGNPEMERRCQEVIDTCTNKKEFSPIRSIHDVGAGGLSNAMPELLDDANLGGVLELRELQIDSKSMSPMEIWCNESQERYVLSIKSEQLEEFKAICKRERCPFAVLGNATKEKHLLVTDSYFDNSPVNIPMDLLLGKTPKTNKSILKTSPNLNPEKFLTESFAESLEKILLFPTVASKKYLITIGDRTVSGLVYQDQLVGPWQVPVADCGITLRDYDGYSGEVMGIGEKAPLAILDGAAAAKMSVAESLLNIAGTLIGSLSNIKLSANWMAASGSRREDQILFEAVHAIGEELCPELGIGIPVGKDSLSMNTKWEDKEMTAPVSLIITSFAKTADVRKSVTPYFDRSKSHKIVYIDLANDKKRLGGSCYLQVGQQMGNKTPKLESVSKLKFFWSLIQAGINEEIIAAYHDISDGGLITTLLEMAFASHSGLSINVEHKASESEYFFNEELGAVLAISEKNWKAFQNLVKQSGLSTEVKVIGESTNDLNIRVSFNSKTVLNSELVELEKTWSKTSYLMSSQRDNPITAAQEFESIGHDEKGLAPQINFEYDDKIVAPYINLTKPKVAILREQGVNGQKEMAMAFYKSGFDAYDVHMQDLIDGNTNLDQFQGLAACGGFSFGDVLGAGKGWANSILYLEEVRSQFKKFFYDSNKFSLGVCNGCQMLSSLKEIIPGTDHWPQFLKNRSEQFEARFSSLKINKSNSLFFEGMEGSIIPVAIAHGEGKASFTNQSDLEQVNLTAQYVKNSGETTDSYPFNPNGSENSVAAISNDNGNILAMMPHPERVFRTAQMSWAPKDWQEKSPWIRMFYNARIFVK